MRTETRRQSVAVFNFSCECDSSFLHVCIGPQKYTYISIWELQINFSEYANLQIQDLWIIRIDCWSSEGPEPQRSVLIGFSTYTSLCMLYISETGPQLSIPPLIFHVGHCWQELCSCFMTNPMAVTDCLASSGPWTQHSLSGWGFMSSLAQSPEQAYGWHPGEKIKRIRYHHPENPLLSRVWKKKSWLTFHPATSQVMPLIPLEPVRARKASDLTLSLLPSHPKYKHIFFSPYRCLF